jgi:hypothetical protein
MIRPQPTTQSTISTGAGNEGERLKKRTYAPPTLVALGTISELTRGAGGASPDGGSQTKVSGV